MIKFTETTIISRSSTDVFAFTQDYSKRLEWDTFLIKADIIGGATEAGKAVRAWCVAKNGMGMETEYISFNPPKVTAIKMTKGPYMFKSFQASWTFKPIKEQETEVIFLYSFSLRFPFNLAGIITKTVLRKNVKQRLRDLKSCMEQGKLPAINN